MILTGPRIKRLLRNGGILCTPLDIEQVAQASIDVHLFGELLEYVDDELDLAKPANTRRIKIPPEGFVLRPGKFYLGATIETLYAPKHVMVLDGKSSVARKGMSVHTTAGYIEPGFEGQVTLEIVVTYRPLRVYAGWPVAQVRFHTVKGRVESYLERGSYVGSNAKGPVPSMSHKHKPRHVNPPAQVSGHV